MLTPLASRFDKPPLLDSAPKASTVNSIPSIKVPPSPINIRERTPNTLCRKKGNKAPPAIMVRQTIVGTQVLWKAMAKHRKASIP